MVLVPIQSYTVDMIRIKCPYCGERDHSEFTYGGDASIKYPALDASEVEWTEAIFFRENIKGIQKETWPHSKHLLTLVYQRNIYTDHPQYIRMDHSYIMDFHTIRYYTPFVYPQSVFISQAGHLQFLQTSTSMILLSPSIISLLRGTPQ